MFNRIHTYLHKRTYHTPKQKYKKKLYTCKTTVYHDHWSQTYIATSQFSFYSVERSSATFNVLKPSFSVLSAASMSEYQLCITSKCYNNDN